MASTPFTRSLAVEMKKHAVRLSFGLMLVLASVALSSIGPMISKHVIDDAIPMKDMASLLVSALTYFAVYCASQVCGILQSYVFINASNRVQLRLKLALAVDSLKSSTARKSPIDAGGFIQRVTGDASELISFAMSVTIDFITQLATLIAAVSLLLSIDWRLAAMILAAVPCIAVSNELSARILAKQQRKVKENQSETMFLLLESWHNRKALRYANAVEYASERFGTTSKKSIQIAMRLFGLQTGFGIVQSLIYFLPAFGILFLGGYWAMEGSLSIGAIVAAMSFMGRVYSPINGLLAFRGRYESFKISRERVDELTKECRNTEYKTLVESSDTLEIAFQDLAFSLAGDDHIILDSIRDAFPGPGIVLLTGENGCGKTTLLDIIAGYEAADSGRIRIGSPNGKSDISFLPQETAIFRDTIRGNILLDRQISDTNLLKMAKSIGFNDFITGDLALDRQLQDNGKDLSGGQRRKIAIMRAFAGDPSVIFLDEPFVGLDKESRESMESWIQSQSSNKLFVLISHEPIVDRTGFLKENVRVLSLDRRSCPQDTTS